MVQLKPVFSSDASPDLRELYDDTERILHIPWTDMLFKYLGGYPDYLKLAWEHVRPSAKRQQFLDDARGLRDVAASYAQQSYTPGYSADTLDEAGLGPGDRADLRDVVTAFEYGSPRVLMVAAAWTRALDGEAIPGKRVDEPAQYTEEESKLARLPMTQVTPEAASKDQDLAKVYEDIMETLGAPLVETFFQSLANWPPALGLSWDDTKSNLQTEAYGQARKRLLFYALDATERFSDPVTTTPEVVQLNGVAARDIEHIRGTLHVFMDVLPHVVLSEAMVLRASG